MSTDDTTPAAATPSPAGPWTVDVLADLHAGRYPPEVTGELRRLVAADPWAASVLTALDATVDQLSLLPTPRMPERFALRLDAAIAGEYRAAADAQDATGDRVVPLPRQTTDQSVSALPTYRPQVTGDGSSPQRRPPSSVGSPPMPPRPLPGPARPQSTTPPPPPATAWQQPTTTAPGPAAPERPEPAIGSAGRPGFDAPVASLATVHTRRRRWIGGLAAAAAVIGIGTASIASLHHSAPTGGLAAAPTSVPTPAPAPGGNNALQLDPGRFGDALQQIEGKRPVGSLRNAATYARCLAANAIDPSAVSGVTSATFDGKPAAAIAVRIDGGHSRVVVVGPGCGIDGAADQLGAQTVPH